MSKTSTPIPKANTAQSPPDSVPIIAESNSTPNLSYEVKKTNKISFKKLVSNEAIKSRLVLKMKDKVEGSRNNLGYAIPEDEFIPKNIRIWNVNYRPGLTSCVKHKFCYGSEPMESTMSPFVTIDQEINEMELLPISFDPCKQKGFVDDSTKRSSASLRAKSVTPFRRNKNPLLPSQKLVVTQKGLDSWIAQTHGYTLDKIPITRPDNLDSTTYDSLKKYIKNPMKDILAKR